MTLVCMVPHPVTPHDRVSVEFRQRMYHDMGRRLLSGADIESCMAAAAFQRREVESVLTEQVPALAESVYQAEFLGMAIDYQPFFVWSTLADRAAKDARLDRLGEDLRTANADNQLRFELLGAAIHQVDIGFDRLSQALAAQPSPFADDPRRSQSDAARAAEALRRSYAADVERPVIDDRYDPPTGRPRLRYPGSAAAYVPQGYRQVRYVAGETHLERDEEWAGIPAADDLGPAITRYLESPYGAESPLLILGHPGSGKSLLTRVYAARLEYPRYTVVRVELRDADPTVSIQKQVEDQIRKDTGFDVNWADLADNLPLSPPVVILDGYDELLQATGKLFTDYLDQVQRFQRDARIQNRPVRVIVTSRITLIDKAIIPPGTTVLRLDSFDEPRRTEWVTRWNAGNAVYFQQVGVQPFAIPDNENLAELAEQPLLLLMLAIFDSADNALSSRPDLDQTVLYDELLRRFIERELGKGEHGAAFSGLPPDKRRPQVDRELGRLGVAAIGMFNRQEVKILRDQLDEDLAYFAAERPVGSDLYGQSQSELLLGSFFFIHESRSRLTADGAQPGPAGPAAATGQAAFEFLHNTFGEFLTANFILGQVLSNAVTIRDLTGKPTLEHARQQHLSTLTPYWFACLLYTPLYSRPNILALLRAWSFRLVSGSPDDRADLLSSLDEIIRAQLRVLLVGTDPLDLSARARSVIPGETATVPPPYDPLPVLGQLAVYSLNLILLRTYLAEGAYILDEASLDAGDRPWDRLTAVWRSWFPAESLGALAMQFAATRTGDQLVLEAARSPLTVPPGSPLDTAYNTALSLADDLGAASLGLHVASLTPSYPQDSFSALMDRFPDEANTLTPIASAMLARVYGSGLRELAESAFGDLADMPTKMPGYALGLAELVDRTVLAPRLNGFTELWNEMEDVAQLTRYEAELQVSWSEKVRPGWLNNQFARLLGSREWSADMELFLLSPAAAPMLRALRCQLTSGYCADLSEVILGGFSAGSVSLYDVDTALAMVLIAEKAGNIGLCNRLLNLITEQCEAGSWSLRDIPWVTWEALADFFSKAKQDLEPARNDFIRLMDDRLEEFLPGASGLDGTTHMTKLWLQMLRIGSQRHRKRLLEEVLPLVLLTQADLVWAESRPRFLLLLRWARENGETELIRRFLSDPDRDADAGWWTHFGAARADGPGAINLDRISADLTYREAMDLRWALDLWRESGAHWPGEPAL